MIIIKKILRTISFYIISRVFSLLIPNFFKNKLQSLLISIPENKLDYILKRVNYYNKMKTKYLQIKPGQNYDLQIKSKGKTYFLTLTQ